MDRKKLKKFLMAYLELKECPNMRSIESRVQTVDEIIDIINKCQ